MYSVVISSYTSHGHQPQSTKNHSQSVLDCDSIYHVLSASLSRENNVSLTEDIHAFIKLKLHFKFSQCRSEQNAKTVSTDVLVKLA